MADPKKDPSYTYSSVAPTPEEISSEDPGMRPKIELGDHTPMMKPRGWIMTIFWQIFGFLWLVPVVALLYLNFTEWVIGASAWCPGGHCWVNAFNPITSVPVALTKKYDKDSHNLLGGLQFVAKALEVWFGIIAAALMYMLTMKMAGKREGLPVGYLTRPMEFADLITILDPLLWKTGPSPFGPKTSTEKRVGVRVWYLIAISIFLCVLINLMGPATAVLVIPALQWITTPDVGPQQFQQMNSASPPSTTTPHGLYWSVTQDGSVACTEQKFSAQNYSCITELPLGNSMDSWLNTMMASDSGVGGYASHKGLTFEANLTTQTTTDNSYLQILNINNNQTVYKNQLWWVPSRQMLSQMYIDYSIVNYMSQGVPNNIINRVAKSWHFGADPIDTYTEYNRSLELTIQRNGPVSSPLITMYNDFNSSFSTVVHVDANRQVRCYQYYQLKFSPFINPPGHGYYTKCIRTGSGWSSLNKHSRFYTEQVYNQDHPRDPDPGVNIDVYTSDKAAFFEKGALPAWLPPACLKNGPLLNSTVCPWERMFTTDPSSPIANRTENVTTVEFLMGDGISNTTLVVDFVTFAGFTTYSLDSSLVSNPTSFVATGDLPSNASTILVDPSWYLAAWATEEGASVQSNRTSSILLQSVMQWQWNSGRLRNVDRAWDNWLNQQYVALIPILQTVSLLDFSTTPVTDVKADSKDTDHPILQRRAQMYVWAYGVTSRTAELGVAVAIAGCLVVVWFFILGFTDRRRYRSPTQLIVAALEHSPRGEFVGREHDEVAMARVRFHIRDNDAQVGKFSFYEPDEKDNGLIQRT